jgi:FkbM family methyltransferase
VWLNRFNNVRIHDCAVANVTGPLRFAPGGNRTTGHLDDAGTLTVDAVALDEFVFGRGNPAPQVIKIDVEGAERQVLEGARRLLETAPPLLVLATHGQRVRGQCCELLRSIGYQVTGILGEAPEQTDELLCCSGC